MTGRCNFISERDQLRSLQNEELKLKKSNVCNNCFKLRSRGMISRERKFSPEQDRSSKNFALKEIIISPNLVLNQILPTLSFLVLRFCFASFLQKAKSKHNQLNVGRIALEPPVGVLINCSLLQTGGGLNGTKKFKNGLQITTSEFNIYH